MVKKRRKPVRKIRKIVKKNKTPSKSVRQDFEVFAKGVQRLEEIRGELNNLNTKGYDDEVASIKSKLKNVSYIPEIEKEMRDLKSKIKGTYRKKESPDEHVKINKKIKELNQEIKRKKAKSISKKESKLISDIPKIQGQISYLKGVLSRQEEDEKRKKELLRKIDPEINLLVDNKFDLSLNEIKAELSKKIKSKELAVQEQLQNDLESRKKSFELEYKSLEDKFSEKYKKRVESSLQNEINSKFNKVLMERVEELKKNLEKKAWDKVKSGESIKLKKLEQEKDKFKKNLFKKLKQEEEEFRKNLLKKLEQEKDKLKQEEGRFKQKAYKKAELKNKKILSRKKERLLFSLNKRYDKLKLLIRSEKEKELKERKKEIQFDVYKKQLVELRARLVKDVKLRKENLERIYDSNLIAENAKLRKHLNEEILAHRARLDNQMHEHLTSEIKKLHKEHDERKKQEETETETMKKRIMNEKGILSKIRNRLSAKMNKLRENEKDYKDEVGKRLEREKQEAVKKAVTEQSQIIKNKLKKEFNEKLKLEIKSKEAEFEKKKADLALEVQKKAKQLFD